MLYILLSGSWYSWWNLQVCPSAQRFLPRYVNNHLEEFFEKFPAFRYNPSAPVTAQFHSLCNDFLRGNDKRNLRKAARTEFKNVLSQTFNSTYGTEVKDLESWQKLCSVLEIVPMPKTLGACRDVRMPSAINLTSH